MHFANRFAVMVYGDNLLVFGFREFSRFPVFFEDFSRFWFGEPKLSTSIELKVDGKGGSRGLESPDRKFVEHALSGVQAARYDK